MMDREEVIARARGCVGARFRPHGRDPRWGLDCVGVAAIAFGREVAANYALRGGEPDAIGRLIERSGLDAVQAGEAAAGDLVLIEEGATQFHMAVLTERGFVHADARLRRVVETPGRPQAPIIGAWREEG